MWDYCQRTGVRGRTLTLKVKYSDFQQITRRPGAVLNSAGVLAQLSQELLESLLPLPQGVRRLGVSLANLSLRADQPAAGQQLRLF